MLDHYAGLEHCHACIEDRCSLEGGQLCLRGLLKGHTEEHISPFFFSGRPLGYQSTAY